MRERGKEAKRTKKASQGGNWVESGKLRKFEEVRFPVPPSTSTRLSEKGVAIFFILMRTLDTKKQ